MRKTLYLLALLFPIMALAQQVRMVKGNITDGIKVNDTLNESLAVYLPTNFDMKKTWPMIIVATMDGKGKQALGMFKDAAEAENFVLISPNNLSDSLTLAENVQVATRAFNTGIALLPVRKNGAFAAGFNDGARFANLLTVFIKELQGVISCGASFGNIEVLNMRKPLHFVGVVGLEDFSFSELLAERETLGSLKIPNHLVLFNGGLQWPATAELGAAMKILKIKAMQRGAMYKDTSFIKQSYDSLLARANMFFTQGQTLLAENLLTNLLDLYKPLMDTDSLKQTIKTLKRSKDYRALKRNHENLLLKEGFTKENYGFYLEEDVITYNYSNLGWWQYQMDELAKLEESADPLKKQMGLRLRGYINALVYDNINLINSEKEVDTEALSFLYMLKTITDPSNFDYYLKIVSASAKKEDYGTALFYLDELLRQGYTDKKALYQLEHTALLRITPEFNAVVDKYLKDARYDFEE